MRILSVQPSLNFESKSKTAQRVLKQFDKDALTIRTLAAPVKKQRLVLEKLMQGFDVHFLEKTLDISKYKIYNLSAKYNARKVYIQDRDNIILQRLLAGQKRTKIAEEMLIDITTVNAIAEKFNAYSMYKANRDNIIKERYLAGMKKVAIARELNVNPETVERALKKMKVKRS